MANKVKKRETTWRIIVVAAIIILLSSAVNITTQSTESLWFDEAWTVYAISSPAPQTFEPPRGTRAQITTPLRAAITDLQTTLERVRQDVHPPLYFFLMDGWVFVAGDSELALRFVSLLFTMITLATLFALGRELTNITTGFYAMVLFGSSMLVIYYSREARMYTLLMLLAVATTLAYARVVRRSTIWHIALYGVLAALALYTHYAAALVLLCHGIHSLFTGIWQRTPIRTVTTFTLPLVLFSPYLPVVWSQLAVNPGGSLAVPLETSLATVAGLGLLLTAGWWWLYAVVLIGAFVPGRAPWRNMLLVLLWLIVTPLVLLLMNATLLPIYQVRYALGALPAATLLMAMGLSNLHHYRAGRWIVPLLAAGMVYGQLAQYSVMFPAKPDYREAVTSVLQMRTPLEPILTDMAPRDPARYYSERTSLTDGIAIDLAWRDHSVSEIDRTIAGLNSAERVWLVMPVNTTKTWRTVAALQGQGRSVVFRANVENMLFYGFSTSSDDNSSVALRYEDQSENTVAIYTGQPAQTIYPDETGNVCIPLEIDFEQTTNTGISVTVVRGYNEIVAQWNGTPENTEACLSLADVPPGDYYTYVTLYDTTTESRVAVMEEDVWWGWWIVAHHIMVGQGTAE